MSSPQVRFRHSPAIAVAAVIMIIAGLSLARWAPALLVLLIVPAAIGIWAWRSGTDAGPDGLTVRATLGQRHVAWPQVTEIVTDARGRVAIRLASGGELALPAVSPRDAPRLVAAAAADDGAGPAPGQ